MKLISKKLLSNSLLGRFLLIIIIPTILTQAITAYIFYQRHWDSMIRNMSLALEREIGLVIADYRENGSFDDAYNTSKRLGFTLESPAMKMSPQRKLPRNYQLLHKSLNNRIPGNHVIIPATGENREFIVYSDLSGDILAFYISKKRLASSTTYIFIMWMIGTGVILLLVALLFLRNQIRSIVQLTNAAQRFGKGQDAPDFKPTGATEIRAAGIAFIQMRERIRRLINKRTQMLAGVSHDLKTPLTRMKLQLEMFRQSKRVKEMQADINEMEHMLQEYLDYTRDNSGEETTDFSANEFIEKLLAGFKNHAKNIDYKLLENDINIHAKYQALRRAISNIVDNGLRYGEHIFLSMNHNEKHIKIIIEDAGDGIDEIYHTEVFQPFYRLESSRNSETGGIGLGLAITRDIIITHGGTIRLGKSLKHGGLKVTVTLPI